MYGLKVAPSGSQRIICLNYSVQHLLRNTSIRPEMKAEKTHYFVLHRDMRKNLQISAFLIPKLYYNLVPFHNLSPPSLLCFLQALFELKTCCVRSEINGLPTVWWHLAQNYFKGWHGLLKILINALAEIFGKCYIFHITVNSFKWSFTRLGWL